jgi:hypothetical protein
MEQIPSSQLVVSQLTRKFSVFYGNTFPHFFLQEPATCTYPEPDQSNPRAYLFDVITSLVSLEHGVYGWEKVTSHREVSSKCAA